MEVFKWVIMVRNYQKITFKNFFLSNNCFRIGLDRMRYDVGEYFGSVKTVEVNLFVQLINFHESWLKKSIPVHKI